MPTITHEVAFLLLIVALTVVPRALQRFRVPAPLSSFGLGMAAVYAVGTITEQGSLALFATLGISSLFLFAGLEIDVEDFKRGKWVLLRHLVLRAITLGAVTYLLMRYFAFTWQVSVLLSLAVLTPSAGFILDTLPTLDIDDEERYWIRMKAISGELFALIVLFVTAAAAAAKTDVNSSKATGSGEDEAQCIADAARARRCDLIVVPCEGRNALLRLLTGSVIPGLITSSTVPVLVVKDGARPRSGVRVAVEPPNPRRPVKSTAQAPLQ